MWQIRPERIMGYMNPNLSSTPTTPNNPGGGLVGRTFAIGLGLAMPTGFLAWVLGFDSIKRWVNGGLWCGGADNFVLDVKITSSGSKDNITDRP